MKLSHLLKSCPSSSSWVVKGPQEVQITGITSDSRHVAPGHLFIVKKGVQYIPESVQAGAVALLTPLYNPLFPLITQIIHPHDISAEAHMAKAFYGHASDQLFLIGITGTSGKTTTSYLTAHLFETLQQKCGLIGGVEWVVGPERTASSLTTSDILTNSKLFQEMQAFGCTACAMEVSSHGLAQGRVDLIEFDLAIFTNLSREHLDYHQTMQEYASWKATLFSNLKPPHEAVKKQWIKTAIINADSPYSAQMVADCKARVLRFGIEEPCDLKASNLSLSASGIEFDATFLQQTCRFHSPLIGRFNVYNLLAAAGAGLARGFALQEIAAALTTFSRVPGRLESVPNDRGLRILVDHAHKPDALHGVLSALKETGQGKLFAVFGCGGDRDRGKRPLMGEIAEALSDCVIVTSDNPRSEQPEEIIRQILSGFKDPNRAHVIADRKEAIWHAVQMAQPGDTLLIAGKGHETYQIFAHQTIDFDDRIVAAAACQGEE